MKDLKKKVSESFEPYKFVFVNAHVLMIPSHNVDKQIMTELRFEAYRVARQIKEELSLLSVQIGNPKETESKVSQYIR